ncbi:protease inhibitor I42 family protein [Streptomyces sp. NPDC002446]
MESSGLPRGGRALVVLVAIAALVIALHSVFSQLSASTVYDAGDTEISVPAGDRFSVRVPDDPAGRYRWILAPPRPDPAVLAAAGERTASDDPPSGTDPVRYLDFEAVRPGRTDLRLLRCRRCTDGAEEAGARTLNFRVTVG